MSAVADPNLPWDTTLQEQQQQQRLGGLNHGGIEPFKVYI